MNEATTTTTYVINLRGLSPRTYQAVIEAELVRAGLTEAAERLHAANPRDLVEIWRYLPPTVALELEVTP